MKNDQTLGVNISIGAMLAFLVGALLVLDYLLGTAYWNYPLIVFVTFGPPSYLNLGQLAGKALFVVVSRLVLGFGLGWIPSTVAVSLWRRRL